MKPTTRQALKLLQEGAKELAVVEANGICIDEKYLHSKYEETKTEIKRLKNKLEKSKVYKRMRRRFSNKTNLNSRTQIAQVLIEEMGIAKADKTEAGNYKMDADTLRKIDHPFVREFLRLQKLQKIVSTYLSGIIQETIDGKLHPFFNLHTTRTYRSSSSNPNFQNMPS